MSAPQPIPVGGVLQVGDLSPQNGGGLADILPRQYGTAVWSEGIFFRPANLVGYVARTRAEKIEHGGRQTFRRVLERARPGTNAWETLGEFSPTKRK